MPKREQVRKAPAKKAEEQAVTEDTESNAEERAAHLAELDELLDEIDEVLVENAAEFVSAYVQKGGQ